MLVGNFVVEKYRPGLAQIATFCSVVKGRKAHNVTGTRNLIDFNSHPVNFIDMLVVESAHPSVLNLCPLCLCMRNHT